MRWTETGFELKRPEFGPEGAPLYGLDLLANYPAAWRWIVEGEKAADWLSFTLDAVAVLSWAGGAASVGRTDWRPLAGQCVVLWPDFDNGGFDAMRRIQDILRGLGCFVLVLDVAAMDIPPKGDAVDFLERFREQSTGLVDHNMARARLAEVAFLRDVPEWRAAA
jgi:DNA primase